MCRSNRTKACDFSKKERVAIEERDSIDGQSCCINCGSPYHIQLAHYIGRALGGLGIKENAVCLCADCHHALDQGADSEKRIKIRNKIIDYLTGLYPDFTDEQRRYAK